MGETNQSQQPDHIVVRLDQQQYEHLEKQCMRIASPTTDLEASFSLGVQFVLHKLRTGFVIGGY